MQTTKDSSADTIIDISLTPFALQGEVEVFKVSGIRKFLFHDSRPINELVCRSKIEKFLKENRILLDPFAKTPMDAALNAVLKNHTKVAIIDH